MKTKTKIKFPVAIAAVAMLLAGCWNSVDVSDETATTDRVIIGRGYRYSPPMIVEQTETNMIITVIFKKVPQE